MLLKPLSPPARFLVFFAMTAPSLLVTVACVLAFHNQGRIEDAFVWVRDTLRVQTRIHQILLDINDVVAGARGYVLTGQTDDLQSYDVGQARILSDLAALRADTASDPEQQHRFMELEALTTDRLLVARQTIDFQRSGRHGSALKLLRANGGNKAMDTIRAVACDMSEHEEMSLRSRDRALNEQMQKRANWLYALLALNLVSLACTVHLLQRLGKAQSLARVCAWSRRVEHEGQWLSFEEYLKRRFNIGTTHTISPDEVDRLVSDLPAEPSSVSIEVPQRSQAS
jgi:CHASE3 domain sensor protein